MIEYESHRSLSSLSRMLSLLSHTTILSQVLVSGKAEAIHNSDSAGATVSQGARFVVARTALRYPSPSRSNSLFGNRSALIASRSFSRYSARVASDLIGRS